VSQKVKIELSLLMPGVPDARDHCVDRLTELLRNKAGIDKAHISMDEGQQTDRLCVHFDPNVMSLAEVREAAQRTGAKLEDRYGHLTRRIESMHAGRASAIESRLSRVEGVLEAVVSPDGAVRVEYDRELTNETGITTVLADWSERVDGEVDEHKGHAHDDQGDGDDHDHAGHEHAHGGVFGPRSELIFAILCGLLLLVGWLLETFTVFPEWISLVCFLGAYLFGGYYTVTEAIEKIRAGKFEIGRMGRRIVAVVPVQYRPFLGRLRHGTSKASHRSLGRTRSTNRPRPT